LNTSKHKVNLLDALEGFQGHLQVDGNVSYEEMGLKSGVTLMHCLVHSRRYFEKALAYDNNSASHALTLIGELYKIEREANAANLDWDEIRQVRQEKSQLILEKLKVWLEEKALIVIPNSPIGIAVAYMLKRWKGLIEYINDGRFRPDNNLIENQIRPLALGRKNYMFAGSHDGAEYAAIFYSFFATCRLNNIDPEKWLVDILNRIENHPINRIEELLPTKDYQFSANM
jgi:hypothetical protein